MIEFPESDGDSEVVSIPDRKKGKEQRPTHLRDDLEASLTDGIQNGFHSQSLLNHSSKEQRMKSCSHRVWLTIAVACSMYLPNLAAAQVFPGQGPRGLPVGQTLENGNVSGNEGHSDNDYYGSYPRTELDFIPFTGRYRNSCYGRVLILESPAGIAVSVNGRTVRAKDGAELRQRYPDAYLLYERTLGRRKRLLFAHFAALKARYSATNRAFAGGGMPGQFDANPSQDRGISLIENGKTVSITRTENGIVVSVDGKRVRADSVAQLRKKFPEAFTMFEEQLAAADGDDGQPAAR